MAVSATRYSTGGSPMPRPATNATHKDPPSSTPWARPSSRENAVGALGRSARADRSPPAIGARARRTEKPTAITAANGNASTPMAI